MSSPSQVHSSVPNVSIYGTATLSYRPWRGFDEPQLPTQWWVIYGTVLGDSSGGSRIIDAYFGYAAQALNSRSYSLETWNAIDTENVARGVQVNFISFDGVGGFAHSPNLDFPMVVSDGIARTDRKINIPVWIGQPATTVANAQLRVTVPNTNGATFSYVAGGYVWSPRSMMAPGGFQRPMQGIYR